MIITPFKNKFNILKSSGIHIQYVLDIGAYRGDFTDTIKSVWPSAIVTQFEADDRQSSWLSANAIIGLLGDVDGKEVDFFTLPPDKITTGSSIFKEQTIHYTNNSTVIIKKEMITLDTLTKSHNFFGNWKDHGLMKLDTQGSELLILKGSSEFLSSKDRKSTRLNSSHTDISRMPSSA